MMILNQKPFPLFLQELNANTKVCLGCGSGGYRDKFALGYYRKGKYERVAWLCNSQPCANKVVDKLQDVMMAHHRQMVIQMDDVVYQTFDFINRQMEVRWNASVRIHLFHRLMKILNLRTRRIPEVPHLIRREVIELPPERWRSVFYAVERHEKNMIRMKPSEADTIRPIELNLVSISIRRELFIHYEPKVALPDQSVKHLVSMDESGRGEWSKSLSDALQTEFPGTLLYTDGIIPMGLLEHDDSTNERYIEWFWDSVEDKSKERIMRMKVGGEV